MGRIAVASLGTNDLSQYTYAADRTDERVRDHARPLGLAILRLVGEPAPRISPSPGAANSPLSPTRSRPLFRPGVRELSVPPSRVPAVKRELAPWTLAEMHEQARRAPDGARADA